VPGDWFQPVTEAQELRVATGTPRERRGDKETTEATVSSFSILSFDLILREGVFAHALLEVFPSVCLQAFCDFCQPIFSLHFGSGFEGFGEVQASICLFSFLFSRQCF
jgi:hypothetical protein